MANRDTKNDAEQHFFVPPVGATDDFRYGMSLNPHMKAFVTHGRYDLVTPYYASDRLRNLMRLDPEPPFSWYIRGMDAMRSGDFRAAKAAFAREVARAPDFHEFHFWLAYAQLALGETDAARAELELALENSTSRRDHDVYAAKLAKLKGGQSAH